MTENRRAEGRADPKVHDHENEVRSTLSDERLIEIVQSQLDPGERTAAQRAAFRARLEERLEHRSRFEWQPLFLTASAAMAALMLWFAVPDRAYDAERSGGGAQPIPVASESSSLLAYAYYETDYLASSEGESDFLSDEYLAIASAFDVP